MAMAGFCLVESEIRDLGEQRQRFSNQQASMLNAGVPWDRVKNMTHTLPPAHAKILRDKIAHGRAACERTTTALANGAARVWDLRTSPNSAGQPRSVETHTKAQSLYHCCGLLEAIVGMDDALTDSVAETLANLREWFEFAIRDLRAVLALQGSPPENPDSTMPREVAAPSDARVRKSRGWTRAELLGETGVDISEGTFDNVRRAAKIEAAKRGGAGQQRRFIPDELRQLIMALETGPFRKYPETLKAWRALLGQ
jgi:hypothetical protein